MTRLVPLCIGIAVAACALLVVVSTRAEVRVAQWRDVANVDAHQLDVINQRCHINRVDGSATCPAGVFGTVKVAS